MLHCQTIYVASASSGPVPAPRSRPARGIRRIFVICLALAAILLFGSDSTLVPPSRTLLVDARCVIASLGLDNSPAVTVTSIQTVGPYFSDTKVTTVDITGGQTGVKVTMTFTVFNVSDDNCARIPNAAVDIWHANAAGKYSNFAAEGTAGQTWLRGYHITGADGVASFTTIYPGWYSGRTPHIHTKLRLYNTAGTSIYDQNTQLFPPESVSKTVYTTVSPYSSRGTFDTSQARDNIFTSATNVPLTITGNPTDGYVCNVPIFYPLGQTGDAAASTASYNAPHSSSTGPNVNPSLTSTGVNLVEDDSAALSSYPPVDSVAVLATVFLGAIAATRVIA